MILAGIGGVSALGFLFLVLLLGPRSWISWWDGVRAGFILSLLAPVTLATAGISEIVRRVVLHRADGSERG